ncbi:hypothetical protein ACQ4PT_020472 [Festuca glaucescens]
MARHVTRVADGYVDIYARMPKNSQEEENVVDRGEIGQGQHQVDQENHQVEHQVDNGHHQVEHQVDHEHHQDKGKENVKSSAHEEEDGGESSDSDYEAVHEVDSEDSSANDDEAICYRQQALELKNRVKRKMLGEEEVKTTKVPEEFIVPENLKLEQDDGSECFDSEDELSYDEDSDGEGNVRRRRTKHRVYDESADVKEFELGQAFHDSREFKQAVVNYGLKNFHHILFPKDERNRVSAICSSPTCKWIIYGSLVPNRSQWFTVGVYNNVHTCIPRRDNKLVTSIVIADKYFWEIKDNPDDLWEQRTHARILVSDGEAGSIIGRGGSAVTALESTSGAHVKVSRRGQLLPGTDCRVLVSGLFHQVMDAAEIILQKILYQGGQVIDERATVVLVVPDACCGVLIGKGGTNIKSLAEASNAGIVISRHDKYYVLHDRLVTITGNLDNQLQAIFLILSELLEDDRYSRALFLGCEDYGPDEHVERYHSRSNTPIRSPDNNDDARESLTIAIADEHIGAVIGCGGSKIREIIQFTGAWIRTSAKGEFIAGTTDREVVISGTREAINTAEGMIMHVVSAARSRSNGSAERPPLKPDTTPQQQEQSTTNDMQ